MPRARESRKPLTILKAHSQVAAILLILSKAPHPLSLQEIVERLRASHLVPEASGQDASIFGRVRHPGPPPVGLIEESQATGILAAAREHGYIRRERRQEATDPRLKGSRRFTYALTPEGFSAAKELAAFWEITSGNLARLASE